MPDLRLSKSSAQSLQGPRAPRRLAEKLALLPRPRDNHGKSDEKVRQRCVFLEQLLAKKNIQLDMALDRLRENKIEFQNFVDSVSHDLQAPLRAISGFSTFLKEECEDVLDEMALEYLGQLLGGATRLKDRLNRLMQYSRVTSKSVEFELVDLNVIVKDVKSSLLTEIEELNAIVTWDNLPMVYGDKYQLNVLMGHLLENAITFQSTTPPIVHISSEAYATKSIIGVRDNGIGIPQELAADVFTIFRRLNSERKFNGVGAGLAICRRILDRHSGEIWFESEIGQGTTFFFSIPQ